MIMSTGELHNTLENLLAGLVEGPCSATRRGTARAAACRLIVEMENPQASEARLKQVLLAIADGLDR